MSESSRKRSFGWFVACPAASVAAVWLALLAGPGKAEPAKDFDSASQDKNGPHCHGQQKAESFWHRGPAPSHEPHAPDPNRPYEHSMDSPAIETIGGYHFQLQVWEPGGFRLVTKFMLLELVAAGLILVIYIPLARRVQTGAPPRGAWDNAFEVLLTFIRDEVAKPNLGEHDADRHVPFLWTLFLFILFNNLLGMIPFAGSPTASIFVTGGLALVAFVFIHGAAIAKMGPAHYLFSYWPQMEIPFGMGLILKPMIFVIEIVGNGIKASVLAVRLFANMFAGHTVLAMILLFILMASGLPKSLWVTVTVGSVLGVAALSLLELFVAFLQAYIFTFLTALFMGMALHPQH